MSEYLYYKRGEEWVRVAADSYSRKIEPIGGTMPGNSATAGFCATNYMGVLTIRKADGRLFSNTTYSYNQSLALSRIVVGDGGLGINFYWLEGTSERRRGGYGGYGWNGYSVVDLTITRLDGKADNCGPPVAEGNCTTIFKLAGSTVLTLDSCPEVSKGDGCADCCGELLTIAKRIAA